MAQGGDFLKRDGSFGESIYGEKFPDESPSKLKHDERGLLTVAVADRDVHGSLFSITFKPSHHLDRKHMVFGKLVEGHEVLEKIESAGNEDGSPLVLVKIINCGKFLEEKKTANKLSRRKDGSSKGNGYEVNHKKKHKKSSSKRRKGRRIFYTSESETSDDSDTDSSDSDSVSDSDSDFDSDSDSVSVSDSDSESSDLSSSSNYKHKKRKRHFKKDRYRRGKKRVKRHVKKHRKHDRRSKRQSKRASDSLTDSESQSNSSDDGHAGHRGILPIFNGLNHPATTQKSLDSLSREQDGQRMRTELNHKTQDEITVRDQSPVANRTASPPKEKGMTTDLFTEAADYPRQNGDLQNDGIEGRAEANATAYRLDIFDVHPGKSRRRSISPKRSVSKSMIISPQKNLNPQRIKSPSVNQSPQQISPRSRSISRSPVAGKKERSISNIPIRSPITTTRCSLSRSPPRYSSRKTVSRSPVRDVDKSLSRSPVKSSRGCAMRSSGRAPSRRSISRSPVRAHKKSVCRSYSRSPDRGRSLSESPREGSPKRIRRGRGFTKEYSYVCKYRFFRTPSPDGSPVRSYRYGRNDRDRRSPRHYRTPPRERTPLRRSPRHYRNSPRGRTPPRGTPKRYRSPPRQGSSFRYRRRRSQTRSPLSESPTHSPDVKRQIPPSRSRSPSESRYSPDLPLPKRAHRKERSSSSSGSPPGKNNEGLVSYGDGSPNSG